MKVRVKLKKSYIKIISCNLLLLKIELPYFLLKKDVVEFEFNNFLFERKEFSYFTVQLINSRRVFF